MKIIFKFLSFLLVQVFFIPAYYVMGVFVLSLHLAFSLFDFFLFMKNFLTKYKKAWNRVLGLLGVIILLLAVQLLFPMSSDKKDMEFLFDKLIDSAGILSAVALAFLTIKISRITQEKKERKVIIHSLSEKVTTLRKALYFIISSCYRDDEDVRECKKEYPWLSYSSLFLMDDTVTSLERGKWYSDNKCKNKPKVELYLQMSEIVEDKNLSDGHWVLDPIAEIDYSLYQIGKYLDATSRIYSNLDEYKENSWVCNQPKFNSFWLDEAKRHFSKVCEGKQEFNVNEMINVISDFNSNTLTRLYRLKYLNEQGLPIELKFTLLSLVSLLSFGVTLPIITLAFFSNGFQYYLLLGCLIISVTVLVFLVVDTIKLVNEEVFV